MNIADWLYVHFFIGDSKPTSTREEWSGDVSFVAELHARCADASCWESGFHLERDGFVSNGVVRLFPRKDQLRRKGRRVEVRVPCARESAMAGYFTLVGRGGADLHGRSKLYVNATPEGALRVFEHLASLRAERFTAKTLNDPRDFTRRDTVLIYADEKTARRLAKSLQRLARWFRAELPPMTKRLSKGVAWVQSPLHDAESFGMHRCRLINEALITAWNEQRDWRLTVRERFEREGLDWERPWFS